MRSHGVPSFPDPSAGGGIQIPAGIDPKAPAFQSAQKECSNLLPGGGPGRGPVSEAHKLGMLRLARCMRTHGVPTFPDPTASQPSPGSGVGIAFGGPGSFIAVPGTMMQSPTFQHAATECGFPGARGKGGPKRAPPPG